MWSKDSLKAALSVLTCVCIGLVLLYVISSRDGLMAARSFQYKKDQVAAAGLLSLLSDARLRNLTVGVSAGSCNCSVGSVPEYSGSLNIDCRCPEATDHKCPAPKRLIRVYTDEMIAKQQPCPRAVVQQQKQVIVRKVEEPWYVKKKVWHYPVRFPRCTMDACFNYSRCDGSDDLLIYIYYEPAAPARYFGGLNGSKWHTRDPDRACLFFVFLDTPGIYRPAKHPNTLPFWNHGLNHVLITFNDMWRGKGHPPETIENASVMISDMHQTIYRPGFDVSIPLPGFRHSPHLQALRPFERKYLLTFRGLRYVNRNMSGEGVLRSHESFRGMHNGRDVIVATSCRHPVNDEHRREDPALGAHCDEDDAAYDRYDYRDLMNSTFGLAPAGIQPNSYRFAEILCAGAIPVLVTDNYVKPFESLVQWHRCILEFPSSQMHRIVPAVRAIRPAEAERRQKQCLRIYRRMFSDNDALLRAAMEAQKVRFMGAFPAWTDVDYVFAADQTAS